MSLTGTMPGAARGRALLLAAAICLLPAAGCQRDRGRTEIRNTPVSDTAKKNRKPKWTSHCGRRERIATTPIPPACELKPR